jgi:hypothetical protein
MKCENGDRVRVAKRLWNGLVDITESRLLSGVVVDTIPGNLYRCAMYRIRFDSDDKDIVTLTPTPNESWVDEGQIYDSFPTDN